MKTEKVRNKKIVKKRFSMEKTYYPLLTYVFHLITFKQIINLTFNIYSFLIMFLSKELLK